jgi:glucose/arabinose dehydrogenase/PKD repeat protein
MSLLPCPLRTWLGPVLALLVALAIIPAGLDTAEAHPGHTHASKVLIFTKTTQFRHTEAIDQGVPVLQAALTEASIDSVHSEDAGLFTDASLAEYDALIMFQTSGDPWTADQKAALQRYVQAGGGIVAVHNATDMRGSYDWWDNLVGTTMPGHANTGTSPGQPGTVRVEDRSHPSTAHLDQRWQRADEWYNYDINVRGGAHVLTTMDESTYDPGSNAMGYDHPISWCRPYDGGRSWVTGMGHFGAHYTNEPKFVQHIVGGVEWAAGLKEGDCGGTVWGNFERVPLDENTSAPFAMDVAADGRVFYTELVRGQIRVFDPRTNNTTTAITIPVYSGGEDGLLGIALAPDFATSGHLYVYYSPASSDDTAPANFKNRLSRFTVSGSTIDPATEKVILEVPARRLPDEPGHTGGGLDFDSQGNLFLSVGDDVNPHSEPSGGYAPLSTRTGTFHDARETSANTNDLRGKLLRIHPEADGTYTIPDGNLFAPGTEKTKPQIYAMGFRNPFRFSVDPETGWVSLADYSPDNGTDAPATRGPAGISEWNLIKSPGNYGWPLCMGNNEPFRDVDYGTTSSGPVVVGDFFDCANPVNDSPRNTGLTNLPPVRAADMYYGYQRSSVPSVIPQGGGLAPMGGPFYRYDAALESDTKFPPSYDGKPFFYEWARNKMYAIDIKDPAAGSGSQVEKVNPFLPQEQFLAPIDSKFGPDGSMYVLDWGGGFGRDNPNSGLHRIDYISGSRSPVAKIEVDKDSGPAPLTVAFDGTGSTDPENEELTYAWDLDGDGVTDATGPTATQTYATTGVYNARLTVTDPAGKDGTTTVPITVGNTRPVLDFGLPPNGSFFDFGDDLSWDVSVTDAEDGTVSGDDVVIQPALGHDGHAHPTTPLSGLTGTTPTSLGGHQPDENIFFALDARYTDKGGDGGANPLTGSTTSLVFPKVKQAEFFNRKSETMTTAPSRDVEGGGTVLAGQDGAWAMYSPVNLHRVSQLALRVSARTAGTIELRRGAADGPLLGTGSVPDTGTGYADVVIDVTDPGETFDLYVVLPGAGERKLNFIEALGQGSSPTTRPTVAITAPGSEQLEPNQPVEVTATAADAQNTVTSVEFFVDGASIGSDTSAPYSVTWTPTTEKLYNLTAVATNDKQLTTRSRIVVAQVGELFGDLQQFSNADGVFEKVDSDRFRITGAGADTWQGIDQYSSLYLPGGVTDDSWEAVVRVNSQANTHGAAKAGLIVRNDVTQPGVSPGYALLGIRPSGGVEWLRDANGDGDIESSDQAGTSAYPTWLKIKRAGTSYTAYSSRNGTTWTQVGPAATLTGAAAEQDIGMFTVSHATAAGAVEFQDFAVDSDPAPVEPEETYAALSCAGPLSDEFSTGLNGKWSVRQPTGLPVKTAGGVLQLPVAAGDINEASPGPFTFAGQPAPTGSWEASTKITLDHATHWQYAGLFLHKSDNEYNKFAFVKHQNGGRFFEFQTETGGVRTNHGSFTVPADFPTTAYLKLVSNGTALTAHYSTNGESWTALTGSAPIKTDAQIGVAAAGDTGATPRVAEVDWFRVTPDREAPAYTADDEFDGTALDGCRWARSVRYDARHASVADGELRVQTQVGDINGNNPLNPRNFVLQAPPEGDWVATTRFKAPLQHRYQLAGLLMYGDDDNYVKADVVAYNAPGAALDYRAELAGEVAGAGIGSRNIAIPETSESGYWYLRVTKTGTGYTAEVSDGGAFAWTPIGDTGITFDKPLTGLGLMAIGPNQEESITVGFDYFHLDTVEDDTSAPTTTLTLSPAAPDGQNDWYAATPSFTLAADDGTGSGVATTEYRIDGGTWTPYTGAVPLTGDGTRTVEYRSTDVAGNAELAGTKTVKVDTVAPETTATTANVTGGVKVTLAATDATSGVAGTEVKVDDAAWAAYTAAVTVTGDGDHEVLYRSTDRAGLVEAPKSVLVNVDATGPTVVVGGVADGQAYGDSLTLDLAWSATDAGSVASLIAALDGRTVQPGALVLSTLTLGDHVLVVTAEDAAGNTTTQRVAFTVRTSFADVQELILRFADDGIITLKVRRALEGELDDAATAAARGNERKAVRHLEEFKKLTREIRNASVRAVLNRDADALIAQLNTEA